MEDTTAIAAADTPLAEDTGSTTPKGTLIAGLLAGLTASACCAGPLVLLMLGVSGSWIGNLSALESIRPYMIIAAVVFLALAFYKIYLKPRVCSTDAACATTTGQRSQKIIFWVTTLIVGLSVSFPWYGALLFD